jgi:hypothetical protein
MKYFDTQKPTVQLLGRWQPWHDGHTELIKKALEITGQVCIMVRDVGGIIGEDAGDGRTTVQDDNPFTFNEVRKNIINALYDENIAHNKHYIIMKVPNIVDISYGRGVGYTFTEHDLGEKIHQISATEIRAQMREEGKL